MDDFLERLNQWSWAPELIDAVDSLTYMRPRSKKHALEELANFIDGSDRGELIELLEHLEGENLVKWAKDCTEFRGRGKAKAIEAIITTYFGEIAAEEGDEEDVEVGPSTTHVEYRSAEYKGSFFDDFAPLTNLPTIRDYQREAIDAAIRAAQPEAFFQVHVATGGGKTLIGNEVVAHFAQRGLGVLWVSKDWELLKQAARDLCNRHAAIGTPGRIGGASQQLHPLPEDEGTVRYTTIQTLSRRGAGGLSGFRPALVVWDECHWGEDAKAGKSIKKIFARRRVPVFGLTATPKEDSSFKVVYRKTFAELVHKNWLARPQVVEPVTTGIDWAPDRDQFGEFAARSIRELAMNPERNQRVIEHWVANAGKYGKTIVFACFIEHADLLAKAFFRRGIAVRVMHSGLPGHTNADSLQKFKTGEITVLVNVVKLTHGIDVPDARTVLLTRPTASDILFAQMVGRASRRAPGKDSFYIVEFTDNILRHGEHLYSGKHFYSGAGFDAVVAAQNDRVATGPGDRPAVRKRHGRSPQGLPTWIPGDASHEELRGLWFRQNQTFGIELELTRDGFSSDMSERRWKTHADDLVKRLVARLGSRVAPEPIAHYESASDNKDYSLWHVERDDSAGWEVTSPILQNAEGFAEVVEACHAIEDAVEHAGFSVNWKTGFHLHLGWRTDEEGGGIGLEQTRRLVQLASVFEPALGTLVAPSRISEFNDQGDRYNHAAPNRFCTPVSSVFKGDALRAATSMDGLRDLADDRYVVLNLLPLSTIGTVEVRMHNGTADAGKILLWTSLWQQLLWAAEHGPAVPHVADRDVIVPDGDIVDLARRFLPDPRQPQQQLLLERLHRRRRQILESWMGHPDLRGWARFAGAWSAP